MPSAASPEPREERSCTHEATFYEKAGSGAFLIRCASCAASGPIGDVREAHEGWERLHGERHRPPRPAKLPSAVLAF